MIKIDHGKLPIYGASHDDKYVFRIREAKEGEKSFNEPFNSETPLTMDTINVVTNGQVQMVLGSVASINTYEDPDSYEIEPDKFYTILKSVINKLTK